MPTVLHVNYFMGKEFGVTFLTLFFDKRRFLRSGFFLSITYCFKVWHKGRTEVYFGVAEPTNPGVKELKVEKINFCKNSAFYYTLRICKICFLPLNSKIFSRSKYYIMCNSGNATALSLVNNGTVFRECTY